MRNDSSKAAQGQLNDVRQALKKDAVQQALKSNATQAQQAPGAASIAAPRTVQGAAMSSVARPLGVQPSAQSAQPAQTVQPTFSSGGGETGSGFVLCQKCHGHVSMLGDVRLVTNKTLSDTPLVAKLSQLGKSVRQTRPHHEGMQFPYKKGKLTCVCGNNVGNIQDNIAVDPYSGADVGLLKFQGICFSVSTSPGRAFTILAARNLRVFLDPRPMTAYEVTPDHVLHVSTGYTELQINPMTGPPVEFTTNPDDIAGSRRNIRHGSIDMRATDISGASRDPPASISSNLVAFSREKDGQEKKENTNDLMMGAVSSCSAGSARKSDQVLKTPPRHQDRVQVAPILGPGGLPVRPGKQECSFFMKTGMCKYGETCKFRHSSDQPTTSRVAVQAAVPQPAAQRIPNDPLRRFFDKCSKTKDFKFDGVEQAQRFAQAVEAYSEDDLPWRLTKRDEYGLKRLTESVHIGGENAIIAIARALTQPRWDDHKFAIALGTCVREIFNTTATIELLTQAVKAGHLRDATNLKALSDFGIKIAFDAPHALRDHSDLLRRFSQALLDAFDNLRSVPTDTQGRRGAVRLQQLTAGASSAAEVRAMIAAAVDRQAEGLHQGPGGRHSNDHVDFREIMVVPTLDEMLATEMPFLPLAQRPRFLVEDPETQLLDRHFRLLREDLIASVREANAKETGLQVFYNVKIMGVELHQEFRFSRDSDDHRHGAVMVMNGKEVMPFYGRGPIGFRLRLDIKRKAEETIRRQFQNGSLVLLRLEDQALAIGRVVREPREPNELNPDAGLVIGVTFDNSALIRLANEKRSLKIVGLPGSFFAYEPVLQCLQKMQSLPFRQELLGEVKESPAPEYAGVQNVQLVLERRMQASGIELDDAQRAAFEHACSHRVALIVGPPGTGKSFIGAELALSILQATSEKILVVCYTNHALDQFLCHMLDKGETSLVRIGGKSKEQRLENCTLFSLSKLHDLNTKEEKRYKWSIFTELEHERLEIIEIEKKLQKKCLDWSEVVDLLEVYDPASLDQLTLPRQYGDGFEVAGWKTDHLWNLWRKGKDSTRFPQFSSRPLWQMTPDKRMAKIDEWFALFYREATNDFLEAKRRYDRLDEELRALHNAKNNAVMRMTRRRVIGATTTGAAKYREVIQSSKPGVLIIEEAGEVLEAHVLSSLPSSVKHVIMIGDHKQLRPKVNTFSLTVSAQKGYDLNLSLFERLITGGLSHKTLEMQHRMRPEISSIARHMTYPQLRDHPNVEGRDSVRGLAANVVFINHNQQEAHGDDNDDALGQKLSKINEYEARMTVEIVQFLLLQGYTSDQIVVLVPYLGQLKLLNDLLKTHDMVASIGERDAEDLDLLLSFKVDQPWHLAGKSARCIRVSTIDNFQGEESDLIVASLVRSNSQGKIGFLGSADAEQRVNVMCTRARLGLIFVGNVECFKNASPVSPLWQKLLKLLYDRGAVFDGLPIKCQLHNSICAPADVCSPEKLEKWCKEGAGCGRPCLTLLACGHACPLNCHPWSHDNVKCARAVRVKCPADLHRIEIPCSSNGEPYCKVKVVEVCGMGHPVVRNCSAVQDCQVCKVLEDAKSEQINEESAFNSALAEKAAQICQETFARMTSECKTSEVEFQNDAEAQLCSVTQSLTQEFEDQRRKADRRLGKRLDEATVNARQAVADAYTELERSRQHDERILQARRADTEQQLARVAEQMERQRIETIQATAAQKEEQEKMMHQLHQALVDSLKSDDENIKEAYEGRPDPAMVQQQLHDLRAKVKSVPCTICMEDLTILDGALCRPDGHFVCNTCFTHHVKEESNKLTVATSDCNIYCPYKSPAMGGCNSPAYLGCLIARHASEDAFETFEKARLDIRESINNQKMQREYDERLDIEKSKMGKKLLEDAVLEERKKIIEDILTLKCPRCRRAFLDFTGCFALTCSACSCAFCAYCLKDCGGDAHSHVAQCEDNISPGRDVFASVEIFHEAQRERRTRLLKQHLMQQVEAGMRPALIQAIARDLEDLGINGTQLL